MVGAPPQIQLMALMSIIDHANLGRVDLNLMVAFDAIMSERNVTRAARRVGVTQSAMSHNLGRLRLLFGDELFSRSAKGVDPTPRAIELADFVRPVLSSIQTGLAGRKAFDPSVGARTFTVGMSDYLEDILLPDLIAAIRVEAPGVSLEVRAMEDALAGTMLDAGDVDVAVGKIGEGAAAHKRRTLWTDSYVVLHHPEMAAAGLLDLETFIASPQIMLTARDGNCRTIDLALAALGMQRSIIVTTPHLAAVPGLVRKGRLMAPVPKGFVIRRQDIGDLAISPLPLEVADFDIVLSWHSSFDRDPAHVWLRSKIVEARSAIVRGLADRPRRRLVTAARELMPATT